MNETAVFNRWLVELAKSNPDVVIVASLEAEAETQGWSPVVALTAARQFSADLHPCGRDGKFIEKLGMVQLFDVKGAPPGQRGKVTSINPNRKSPGNPDVIVQLPSGQSFKVKPSNIEQAPEKARLDLGGNARKTFSQRIDERGDLEPNASKPPPPPPETPEQRERRKAASEARRTPDDQLVANESDPEAWRAAVENEKAARAARRAQDAQRQQALIDDVNTQAAALSTTDPQARAEGLDEILAKLRFSIIDTDKTHDHIYPPGESGRWTPERTAQHEEMWQELLANVEAAGIPKDHDAFVLGGLPGAGKSYSLRPGQKADGFGVTAWETNAPVPDGGATHVSINPDIVKEMLIDRNMLPEGLSDDLKPMEKVTFIHEESSYLAKVFSQRLGDEGYNIVLDNTFDSEGGMLKRMTPLAREGYKFRGLFVDIPVDESKESAKKRYLDAALTPQGGRFVPSSVQGNRGSSKGTLSKNRDAFDSMVEQDWFTDWMVVNNTGITNRTPLNEVTGQGSGGGTAAGAYLPGADKAPVKQGPKLPTPAEAPPTIDVGAPAAPVV